MFFLAVPINKFGEFPFRMFVQPMVVNNKLKISNSLVFYDTYFEVGLLARLLRSLHFWAIVFERGGSFRLSSDSGLTFCSLFGERGDLRSPSPAFFNLCGLLMSIGELMVSGSSGPDVAAVPLARSFWLTVSITASADSKTPDCKSIFVLSYIDVSALPA